MKRLLGAGLALLVTAVFPSLVSAARLVPEFVIKSDKVEAEVLLDAKIKADPALAANCLSEGRKWAKLDHADNVESRRDADPDLVEWISTRYYEFVSIIADRYVSVKRTDSISFGQMVGINTILWDKKAGRRISVRPFFRETEDGGATLTAIQTAIVDLAMAKIDAEDEVAEQERERYRKRVPPNLLKIGPVSLAPSTDAAKSAGLVFHYVYFTGALSDGAFDAFVPWKKLEPYLSPEGARLFGGALPDDGQQ